MREKIYQDKIITIPNILTFVRLLLIPVFGWLYCVDRNYVWSAVVITFSGLTDVADGVIARRCRMESNLGRMLDPIADKLTQVAMCIAMIARYPLMLWLLILFGVKEFVMAALGAYYLKRTGIVMNARWYGKASSIIQFAVMIALIVNPTISLYSAQVLISLCIATHVISLLMYVAFYIRLLRNPEKGPGVAMRPIDWQVMTMYLLLMLAFFVLMFTSGDSFLHDVLPKPLYLFLRFASIIGTIGIPAFFWGEKVPRSWFNFEKLPFASFAWEQDGMVYEKIGIRWWKTHTPDMSKYIRRAFPKQGNMLRDADHLRKLVAETCSAEFVHWVLILLSPAFAILMDELGVLCMILYIIGNLVSIVIQRYNRPRLVKIIQRIERRKCADC